MSDSDIDNQSWFRNLPQKIRSVSWLAVLMRLLYALIPSFSHCGLITKVLLTALLAGFCSDLFYARINPALPLFKGAIEFSPVKYAQRLADEGKLKTAEDYMEFYASIPGVSPSQEFLDLQKKIRDERHGILSGAMHQGRHILKGIKGEESDELAGQASDIAIDFTGAGDGRDLYKEWQNYSEGREVDKLSAGLAGIGLAMTLGEWAGRAAGVVTGGTSAAAAQAALEPVRQTTLAIRKSLKIMNPKLKKAFQNLFDPVFAQIRKTSLLKNLPNPMHLDEVKAYASKHIKNIDSIAKLAKGKIDQLGDVVAAYRANPQAAKLIAENATSIKSVSSLSRMTVKLGEKGREIFRFGGKAALDAMASLGRRGQLSVAYLKSSMRVGADGLKAVAKGCWRGLDRMISLAGKYAAMLWLFMVQWFLSKIPLGIAIAIELLLIAILAKTWLGPFLKLVRKDARAN